MNVRTYCEEAKLRVRLFVAAWAAFFGIKNQIAPVGRLWAKVFRSDGSVEDIGLISTKLVTDAGVAYIVDAFQNLTEVENLKYHGAGTLNTAENANDTALGVEVESRATGSVEEGASANIYKTVGVVNFTATRSIVEHGIFSATSGGTLLDRSVFAAVSVNNGDSIQFTYQLTFPSGN